MRKQLYLLLGIITTGFAFYIMSCNSSDEKKADVTVASATTTMSQDELIKKGDYIVSTGACNDCHSPKVMTAMGPLPDSSKILSGHPANAPLPAMDINAGRPGYWVYLSPDITAFVGPWGISYAANLTPDSATGIGAWSEATFINALRSGRHLGLESGRPILPPMPWPDFGKKTDEDLKAVYAYLRSLPPISNKVPAPVSPADLAKMVARK